MSASTAPTPFPVVRPSDLSTADASSAPWLIDQLWTAHAVGIIGGTPKSYKTWMALEMAVSVASGSACLTTFAVPSPGPVLLYAAEDSQATLRLRLESLAQHHGLTLACLDLRIITADSLRLDRTTDQERLEATLLLHRPALLILDPLVRLHAIDENAAGEIAALLGYLRLLQRKSGAAKSPGLLRSLCLGRFVPLLAPTPRPTSAFGRAPVRFRRGAVSLGTGDLGIWAIPETGFGGAAAWRSSPGSNPRFTEPIFRTVHCRKSPFPSAGAQSASRRNSAPTLRARQSRALTSRLSTAAQLRFATDRFEFAAGRAAVKPACRVRQARGLRRGSPLFQPDRFLS